jgi:hypothetical protein
LPPHCHRRNAAERAIRTFKEHFVAGVSSVDPAFPLHLWDRLLPQAEITLNLLQTSRLHPQLSAAAHFHGLVDYNKTAFAPPGCKIIAHEKPGKRRTWAPHGQHGYSLGPAMHHYRCQNVYISSTASERIVDTLEFFPHNYQMPQLLKTTPIYGAKTQYIMKDETPPLTTQQYLTIQKVTGSVLYYARAVYPTVLMPLNDIATEQTKATEKTQSATNQLLDYLGTHPDATIQYHASDMILHIHSDASYLSDSNARSRLGGLFFIGQQTPQPRLA